ncbi:MAG: ethanolamine utilization microcompartment protein EutL [Oscillospiraceae bacterium]|nr:ethanolamine utilization microcompartment protein EutL [Oscillospiraceae bacterium]
MIPVKILALQYIPNASPALCDGLGIARHSPSLGLVTTDTDDATYIALDEATKAADVTVSYARSFYAGAANASTPNAGEVIGILSAATPGAIRSGMAAVQAALGRIGFSESDGVPYLAHTVSSCGSFLAAEAGVRQGDALAYLIAPPLEAMVALDAALKASDVRLCKLFSPPSETNFGGGLLTGTQSACAAACDAFAAAVQSIANQPIDG